MEMSWRYRAMCSQQYDMIWGCQKMSKDNGKNDDWLAVRFLYFQTVYPSDFILPHPNLRNRTRCAAKE